MHFRIFFHFVFCVLRLLLSSSSFCIVISCDERWTTFFIYCWLLLFESLLFLLFHSLYHFVCIHFVRVCFFRCMMQRNCSPLSSVSVKQNKHIILLYNNFHWNFAFRLLLFSYGIYYILYVCTLAFGITKTNLCDDFFSSF